MEVVMQQPTHTQAPLALLALTWAVASAQSPTSELQGLT